MYIALTTLAALAITPAGASATEVHTQSVPRGYRPPENGRPAPLPSFPGLSDALAEQARRELAAHDEAVARALVAADEAARGSSGVAKEPVMPDLPGVAVAELPPPRDDLPVLRLPAETMPRMGQVTCAGNCYQSDRAWLSDHPDDVYASDYYVWLAIPQSNETNRCDGSNFSSGCFWFYAMNYYMDCCNAAIHIGPQRGDSLAGNAGANWRMNIDGYNDGEHVGGQSSTNLPVATWIRVRTWQVASGNDGAPFATYGVWAMWGGVDHYLGSVTIDGTYFTNSMMFMEVYEQNGQCATDLERGYFHHPTYQRGGTWYAFPEATADYEANCNNTSWLVEEAPDHIRDERETTRKIQQGDKIWTTCAVDVDRGDHPGAFALGVLVVVGACRRRRQA